MPIIMASPAFLLKASHFIFFLSCPSSPTTAVLDSMSRDEITWFSSSPVTKMERTN
jgi:hypothetical protein